MFVFSGRASRSKFWWFVFFRVFVFNFNDRIHNVFLPNYKAQEYLRNILGWELVFIALEIYFLVCFVSVAVRRLHDCNFSGFWALILVLTYVNASEYVVFEFIPTLSDMSDNVDKFIIGVYLLNVALHLVLIKKGTDCPNKYGADPLGPKVDVVVFS